MTHGIDPASKWKVVYNFKVFQAIRTTAATLLASVDVYPVFDGRTLEEATLASALKFQVTQK